MQQRRLWRPQIRLRTLVLIMLAVGLACGWWVRYLESFRREQAAAARLAKLGAKLTMQPVEPLWIPKWLDRGVRHHVIEVNLSHKKFDNRELEALTHLPQLQTLLLNRCSINDEGLAYVGQCRNLRTLSLWSNYQRDGDQLRMSDQGVAKLRSLAKLQRLDLHDTRISGTGFARWQVLPDLSVLRLHQSALTDEGLAHLANKTPHLVELNLAGTPITGSGFANWNVHARLKQLNLCSMELTDAGLAQLAGKLPSLEELQLRAAPIAGTGFANWEPQPGITKLDLCYTRLNDEGLAALGGKLPSLRTLDLRDLTITGSGFAAWGTQSYLSTLNLSKTQLDLAGAQHLARLGWINTLVLAGTPLDDAGLEHIANCQQVRYLHLQGTQVTSHGLVALRKLRSLQELGVPVEMDLATLVAVHRDHFPQCTILDSWCCGCMEITPVPQGPKQACWMGEGNFHTNCFNGLPRGNLREKFDQKRPLYAARNWEMPEFSARLGKIYVAIERAERQALESNSTDGGTIIIDSDQERSIEIIRDFSPPAAVTELHVPAPATPGE